MILQVLYKCLYCGGRYQYDQLKDGKCKECIALLVWDDTDTDAVIYDIVKYRPDTNR